jgi:hypothetical protein
MKRFATLIFYVVGAVAIAYLALYAYAALRGRTLTPGDPIRIFRKPDAPSYSAVDIVVASRFSERLGDFFFPSPLVGEGKVMPSPQTRDDRCCRPV